MITISASDFSKRKAWPVPARCASPEHSRIVMREQTDRGTGADPSGAYLDRSHGLPVEGAGLDGRALLQLLRRSVLKNPEADPTDKGAALLQLMSLAGCAKGFSITWGDDATLPTSIDTI